MKYIKNLSTQEWSPTGYYGFVKKSKNRKTGEIPVTISSPETCPSSCPLKQKGCYANAGPLKLYWNKIESGRCGQRIYDMLLSIMSLPDETIWRHNQAGDLYGENEYIDKTFAQLLVQSNKRKKGFTYTHKWKEQKNLEIIEWMNKNGFTVNVSCDTYQDICQLQHYIGRIPLVILLSSEFPQDGSIKKMWIDGIRIMLCPAYYKDITCKECQLCVQYDRKFVIGFPAHGNQKRKVDEYLNHQNGDIVCNEKYVKKDE